MKEKGKGERECIVKRLSDQRTHKLFGDGPNLLVNNLRRQSFLQTISIHAL